MNAEEKSRHGKLTSSIGSRGPRNIRAPANRPTPTAYSLTSLQLSASSTKTKTRLAVKFSNRIRNAAGMIQGAQRARTRRQVNPERQPFRITPR